MIRKRISSLIFDSLSTWELEVANNIAWLSEDILKEISFAVDRRNAFSFYVGK